MPLGWRIGNALHAKTIFSGEGARRYGGRWNSPGRNRLIYLSEHQSLALLEVFIHTQPLSPLEEYVVISAEWDGVLMETVALRSLPQNWRTEPPGPATTAFGDLWAREMRSAVLATPSVVVPAEFNYLINPAHPDFPRIKIGKPVPFVFDPRLYDR